MSIKINKLKQDLKNKKIIIILDGAMGTEITARGVKTTLPLWSASCLLTNPEIIRQIHIDYIKAGARIITTNTFRTTRRAFDKVGKANQAKKATILACKLAKQAIVATGQTKDVLIAGSIAPLEDCYSPQLVPPMNELRKEHLENAKNLKAGGADFLLLETMISLREIKAVLEAAKKVRLPVAVSFCCDNRGRLLSRESLEDAIKLVSQFNPLFITVNCMNIETITKVIKKLRKLTDLPIGAYGQGDGEPDNDQGWRFNEDKGVKIYLNSAKKWVKDGAQVIGGCCGTNSEYIKSLGSLINIT